MYKTSDVGRRRSNLSVELLGRQDEQVRIRDYRIEPGEIEVQLAHHPQVKEAVVLACGDAPGEKSLVLDRHALPAPEQDAYGPPQGEVEEMLAGLWLDLLGVEKVDRRDRFIELGGNLLLWLRGISRLTQPLHQLRDQMGPQKRVARRLGARHCARAKMQHDEARMAASTASHLPNRP